MHPGFYRWWKHARDHAHGQHGAWHGGGCGPAWEEGPGAFCAPGFDPSDVSNAFGVRRPLRFLAHKLDLSEAQVATFAAILDDLKTERAQAAVDQRRRISALAEALEGGTFDDAKVQGAGAEQIKSAERIRAAVEQALKKMHGALDDEQRKTLAYLLRTGVLTV